MTYTISEIIAAYGALVATLVALVELVRHLRSGPRFRFKVRPNMRIVGGPHKNPNTYLSYELVNIGTSPSTLTGVGLQVFDSWLHRFRGQSSYSAVVVTGVAGESLPKVIGPGELFRTFGEQSPTIEKMIREKIVYGMAWHSFSTRTLRARIRFVNLPKKPEIPIGSESAD